ncbi:D-2-hydroxyacid dehydrogenase family protein [Comamonas thiooxydans]|uniref:D-2-hydroxyacid dehydrogenase family protein n=1 Tax=Comamonas thiooxydans TaxID=363952 RepID=UPI00070B4202|nr:D-2-hydroxyacid dehydrogenase family protein [Comamonas thiooxydans]
MTTTTPRIVVLDDWENSLANLVDWPEIKSRAQVTIYNRHLEGAELVDALYGAQCVVLFRDRTPFGRELLTQLPNLQHIVSTGSRNQKLDREAAVERGIAIDFTEWGPSKASTCEMTWSLILSCARRLTQLQLTPAQTHWRRPDAFDLLPQVLSGKTLGLIGLGQIGQRVAAVGKAFGMKVVTWSPNMTPERAQEHGVEASGLEELLEQAHVVSLHLVPSPTTKQLINEQTLAKISKSAILVNTSRAELIDMPALVRALQEKRIGYAGLDVFDQEPLAADHPLMALDNVTLTSHYGFICKEVLETFAVGVRANLLGWLASVSIDSRP